MNREWMFNNGMSKFEFNIEFVKLYENMCIEMDNIETSLKINKTRDELSYESANALVNSMYTSVNRARKYAKIGSKLLNENNFNKLRHISIIIEFKKKCGKLYSFIKEMLDTIHADFWLDDIDTIDDDHLYDFTLRYLVAKRAGNMTS